MPRILVIDDEPGMRQVISKILVPLGYEVISADEGARSIQITKEQDPDVILLDIRLADMDSGDIIAGLKNIKPSVPIIILSGFGDTETAVELVKLGAFGYISKPFKVNDFVNLIDKALSKAGYRPAAAKIPGQRTPGQKGAGFDKTPEAAAAIASSQNTKSLSALIIGIAALFLVTAAGFAAWKYYFSFPGDAQFQIPFTNPSGICFDKNDIWVTDWAGESIYKYSLGRELKAAAVFKTQDIAPTGIAFDGKNIWTTSSLEQKINRHNLNALLSVDSSFASPGPSPSGLCFDGKNLWSVDFQQGKLYKHKAGNSLETEASYDLPAQNPCGLFIHGGFVYIADGKTNRIYKLSTDNFFLAGVYEMPGFDAQKRRVASIGFDGKSVWACAGGVGVLYRYKLSSLKRVQF